MSWPLYCRSQFTGSVAARIAPRVSAWLQVLAQEGDEMEMYYPTIEAPPGPLITRKEAPTTGSIGYSESEEVKGRIVVASRSNV